MEGVFGHSLTFGNGLFLAIALALALSFEFVNGFHDTANAVATVIYTHSLKPNVAVIWSGIWNLIGALASSGAVAYGILALLPIELVLNVGSTAGVAMVFALLLSAIIWNVGTWYLGLPASSSHTIIGSIMGVGLADSLLTPGHSFGQGVNWDKVKEVGTALLVSPVLGFCAAALLLLVMKLLVKRPELYRAPGKEKPPPPWIRGLLVLTCTGVSFAHGSNDGQKGMGLIMLILIGILPGVYALDMQASPAKLQELAEASQSASVLLDRHSTGAAEADLPDFLKTTGRASEGTFSALAKRNHEISETVNGKSSFKELNEDQRRRLRSAIYLVGETIGKLSKANRFPDPTEKAALAVYKSKLEKHTKFIPIWVKFATAMALGFGTMIGWKRIVVTVGEKIGKEHLTYAQGASAELVAMATIGAADAFGLPVSTTHVLSSGIAGTMLANHSGLQIDTLRNLVLAWVLTLPVCVLLGAGLFSGGLLFLLRVLGMDSSS